MDFRIKVIANITRRGKWCHPITKRSIQSKSLTTRIVSPGIIFTSSELKEGIQMVSPYCQTSLYFNLTQNEAYLSVSCMHDPTQGIMGGV